jgi:hypothetical protein
MNQLSKLFDHTLLKGTVRETLAESEQLSNSMTYLHLPRKLMLFLECQIKVLMA